MENYNKQFGQDYINHPYLWGIKVLVPGLHKDQWPTEILTEDKENMECMKEHTL